MRVVIDTNCLLVAVPARSPHKWLYEAFVEKRFEWAISNEIFREYEEKLTTQARPLTGRKRRAGSLLEVPTPSGPSGDGPG